MRELVDQGNDVFLDLKFYDIPETVRRAVAQVARTGVRFLTVHAVPSVMRAAVEGKGDSRTEAARRHRAHQLRSGGPRRDGLLLRSIGTGRDARAAGDGRGHRRHRIFAARSGARCGGSPVRMRSW